MQKIILIIIIAIVSFSCKEENTGFQIDAEIAGIPDGRKVFLKKQEDRQVIVVDSTTVQQGKFSFKGKIEEPIVYGIFIDSVRQGFFPFVNISDKIKVTAYKDSIHRSIIKGSELNDELVAMRKGRDAINDKAQSYYEEFQEAQKSKDTATVNRINKILKGLQKETMTRDWNFIKNNPNSYVTPLILGSIMTSPEHKDSMRIVFNNLSEKIKTSELSKSTRDYFEFLDKQKETPKAPSIPMPPVNKK